MMPMSTDLALIDRPEPHDLRIEKVVAAFKRHFGRRPEGIAEAPGRVNLIGEHVDYNDGLVLPFAFNRSVLCAWAIADGRASTMFRSAEAYSEGTLASFIEFYSVDLDDAAGLGFMGADAHEWDATRSHDWADYPEGIVWALRNAGITYGGVDAAITGDVPQGAGLSSSAAIEVAVAGAFRDAFKLPIDDVALARLCQRAENEYVGVQSGIMDQFASTLSQRDHALLIDCRSLEYEAIPLRLEAAGYVIVIANSAVKRELVTSAYNERRRECGEAIIELRKRLAWPELSSLRDVTVDEIERAAIDSVPLRRARHVVREIARVSSAVGALNRDDIAALGDLMVQSHESLRDDYEVSSEQLDLLVDFANAQDYVAGARLTGAGFGGCTVNLVRADAVEDFACDVIAPYRERMGLPAVMYVTTPQDGLRTWRL